MLVYEFKLKGKQQQFNLIDQAIRTALFIRNSCVRYWIDNKQVGKYDLSAYCKILAKNFEWASKLNSMARQASADRAWSAISRFYSNCKKKVPGKKGYPRFKKRGHSVEYKTTGWKLSEDRKYLTLTDDFEIGRLKLIGTYDLHFYQIKDIKRIRLVKRADGYYAQLCIAIDRKIEEKPTTKAVGLDVGLTYFYTDSDGNKVDNPRFLRKSEKSLRRLQKRVSQKFNKGDAYWLKKKGEDSIQYLDWPTDKSGGFNLPPFSKNRLAQPQSNNYKKAKDKLARKHLKLSRQRKDFALKLAKCVIQSADLIAYEDLQVRNMVKNHKLAKSISDASWYQFRCWLEYFGNIYGKITIALAPQYTSINCSSCGREVKKTLSTRTHKCICGAELCRDQNAALNILAKSSSTVGHTGSKAWGQNATSV